MRANGGAAPESNGTAGQQRADDLVAVVRRAKKGEASPQDVFDEFLRARVYCERPEQPGFLAVPAPKSGGGDGGRSKSRIMDLLTTTSAENTRAAERLVPVFTSLEQFALFTDGGAWFSTTGADVLNLLPPGLDIWLDPAADHAVRLTSSATKSGPVLHITYRPRGSAA